MQSYEVTRSRAGRTVDRYVIQARSGLEAIRLSRRDDLDDNTLTAHAFALSLDDGAAPDHARDATRICGQLFLFG